MIPARYQKTELIILKFRQYFLNFEPMLKQKKNKATFFLGVLFLMMLHFMIPHEHIHADSIHNDHHGHHHSHKHDSSHSHDNDNFNFSKKVLSSFPVSEHTKSYHTHQFVHLNSNRQLKSQINPFIPATVLGDELNSIPEISIHLTVKKFLPQKLINRNIPLRAPPVLIN